MTRFVRSALSVMALTLIASHASFASPVVVCVPEIDPAMGAGTLALLGGVIMVIRGRKRA